MTLETIVTESTAISVSLDLVMAESWEPKQNDECYTPNLMEEKGEPYYFLWDAHNDNFRKLHSGRRVHKTVVKAYQQQVSYWRFLSVAPYLDSVG